MTTIQIDGIIGYDVLAKDVRSQLESAGDVEITINSPGGDVAEGLAIHNALRDHRREGHAVNARVVGLAASMATYIPMAASRITVEDNAVWMIHNPSTFAFGDYRSLRKTSDILDGLAATLARAYAPRLGGDIGDVRKRMDQEQWLFGAGIVDAGFADDVMPAGDGPDTGDEAVATARTIFRAMENRLRDDAHDQTRIDKIAAMLPQAQEAIGMTDQNTSADPGEKEERTAEPAETDGQAIDAKTLEARINAAVAKATTEERARVARITARCSEAGMPDLAKALVESGADLAACNEAIVHAYVARGGPEIRQTTDSTPSDDATKSANRVREAYARINHQLTGRG